MSKKPTKKHIWIPEESPDRICPEPEKFKTKTPLINKTVLHLILILVIGFISYSNTFDAPFQWDEERYINENPVVKDFTYFLAPSKAKHLGNIYTQFVGRYVGFLTFALNYKIHGLDVTGYHIVNFMIHMTNALLVYFLISLTFKTPFLTKSMLAKYSKHIAFFSALFFVSHPVQIEAVTYIFQRLASLVALFYLLSIVLYIRSHLSIRNAEKYTFFILSFISAVFAMKTKENSFTLPFVIMLYEFFFFTGPVKSRVPRLIPFIMTLFIIPLTLIRLDQSSEEIIASIGPATVDSIGIARWDYFVTQFRVVVTYIRLLFLPINQNLDYSYPLFNSFFNLQVFPSFLLLLLIFGFSCYLFYRSRFANLDLRLPAFGIFWFFITLSVESSLIPLQTIINEYRVYLPSVGFFIAITTGIFLFIGKIKNKNIGTIMVSSILIMVFLSSYATYTRNSLWKSKISLWEDVVKKSPKKIRAYRNLGNAYMLKGLTDKAIEHFLIALQLMPDNAKTHNNLGNAYMLKGLTDKAIEHFLIALQLMPDNAKTHNNLGNAYMLKGLTDKAIEHFLIVLQLMPNDTKAHNNLGNAYMLKGLTDKAIEHFLIALRLSPNDTKAHNNLGNAYMLKGLTDKAIEHFLIALKLSPNIPGVHFNLGLGYLKKGLTDKAREEFEFALKLNPAFPKARQYIDSISQRNKIQTRSVSKGESQ